MRVGREGGRTLAPHDGLVKVLPFSTVCHALPSMLVLTVNVDTQDLPQPWSVTPLTGMAESNAMAAQSLLQFWGLTAHHFLGLKPPTAAPFAPPLTSGSSRLPT
jgi:hypothetical protein